LLFFSFSTALKGGEARGRRRMDAAKALISKKIKPKKVALNDLCPENFDNKKLYGRSFVKVLSAILLASLEAALTGRSLCCPLFPTSP